MVTGVGDQGPVRCRAQVWRTGAWRAAPCRRPAVRDGWCGTHHPEAVAKRKTAQEAKHAARRAAWEQRWTRQSLASNIVEAALADDLDRVRTLASQLRQLQEKGA